MKQRIATIAAVTAAALLLCTPLALGDDGGDEESRHNLAIFLAICVVIASAAVMELTNRHFKRKRRENERRNRERAKGKKKRKR